MRIVRNAETIHPHEGEIRKYKTIFSVAYEPENNILIIRKDFI